MYPITTDKERAYPFQTISWDLITDLPKSGNFDSVLTIVDHDCSKAALFFPCSKDVDTTGVAVIYTQQVFIMVYPRRSFLIEIHVSWRSLREQCAHN
jgi:hypothetical protein